MFLRQQNENPVVPPPQPKMKVHQNWRGNGTDGCPESSPLLEAPMGFLKKVTVPNQPNHVPQGQGGKGHWWARGDGQQGSGDYGKDMEWREPEVG